MSWIFSSSPPQKRKAFWKNTEQFWKHIKQRPASSQTRVRGARRLRFLAPPRLSPAAPWRSRQRATSIIRVLNQRKAAHLLQLLIPVVMRRSNLGCAVGACNELSGRAWQAVVTSARQGLGDRPLHANENTRRETVLRERQQPSIGLALLNSQSQAPRTSTIRRGAAVKPRQGSVGCARHPLCLTLNIPYSDVLTRRSVISTTAASELRQRRNQHVGRCRYR